MNKTQIRGVVRHALTFAGGYLVASGLATPSDISPLATAAHTAAQNVDTAIGSVMSFVGLIWSLYEKIAPEIQAMHLTPVQVVENGVIKMLHVFTAPAPEAGAQTTSLPKVPGSTVSLLLLALIPACLLFHGCTTLDSAASSVPASTVQNAAQFVEAETRDAAAAYIAHHPHYAGDFTTAAHALDAFVAAGGTDPNALRAAVLASIPADDQADFAPLVDAAVGAYSLYASAWVQKETSGAFAQDAKTLLSAVDKGLLTATTPTTNQP